MKKHLFFILTFTVVMCIQASVSFAHVVVFPKETTQGAYEKFTVRVPSEKEVPTVKVKVVFPDPGQVEISRFEPIAGWKYEVEKDTSERITSVTWTPEGKGIAPMEFMEFNMQGKVGDEAKSITWKAYQTYSDGETVEWIGAEGSDKPASVTTVNKSLGEGDHHGTSDKADTTGNDAGAQTESKSESTLPLYLSAGALILSVLTLIVALKKRS